MNTEIKQNEVKSPATRWILPAVLGAGLLGTGAFVAQQNTELDNLRREVQASRQETTAMRQNMAEADQQINKVIQQLKGDFATTESQTQAALQRTQILARKHADTLAQELEKKQQATQQALNTEIGRVREVADDTNNKLLSIKTDVGTVRDDVTATRNELNGTAQSLERVRGDMGVMSGLIATNGKEIEALRQLGDRNIYAFTITKANTMQRVGDIQLKLKRSDAKRNKFTVEVLADDKLIEKKDKTTNEPVQFYVASKARQPYELVINEVGKDKIVGYLATPKLTLARK